MFSLLYLKCFINENERICNDINEPNGMDEWYAIAGAKELEQYKKQKSVCICYANI